MIPASPFRKISGTNTTIVVSVEALTAIPTSSLPNIAASRGATPCSTFVAMFSSTTTALSTTIPIAIARLAIEMMLMVHPIVHRKMNARISENGIVSAMISAERTLRRKKKAVSTTNTNAQRTVSATLEMDWVICSLVSKIWWISMSRGSIGWMLRSSSRATSRAVSTVFAPDRFWIIIMIARRSCTFAIRRSSAKPSSTAATSRRRTCAPPADRITMSPISAAVANSPGTRIV